MSAFRAKSEVRHAQRMTYSIGRHNGMTKFIDPANHSIRVSTWIQPLFVYLSILRCY